MNNVKLSPQGFSLPEVIISVAIISLTALGVSTLFIEGTKSTKRADQGSACTNHLNTVMNRFRSLGTRTETLDFLLLHTSSPVNRWPVAGGVITPEGTPASLVPNDRFPLNANFNITNVPGAGAAVQTQNAHLIKGMINGLTAIYNSQADVGGSLYCQTAAGLNYVVGLGVESDLFAPSATTNTLRNLNTTIRIQPFQLNSGTVLACNNAAALTPIIIAPRGNPSMMSEKMTTGRLGALANGQRVSGTRTLEAGACVTAGAIQSPSLIQGFVYCDNPAGLNGIEFGPRIRNDLGLLVSLRANFQDANGNAGGCTAQMRVQYPDDNNSPPAPEIKVHRNTTWGGSRVSDYGSATSPTLRAAGDQIHANCQPRNTNNIQLRIGYETIGTVKSGVTFLCRDRSYALLPPESTNASNPLQAQYSGCLNAAGVRTDAWRQYRPRGLPGGPYGPFGVGPNGFPSPQKQSAVAPFAVNPWTTVALNDVPYLIGSSPNQVGALSSFPGVRDFGNMVDLSPDKDWKPCDKVTVCGQAIASGTVTMTATQKFHQLEWNNLPSGCVMQLDSVAVDGAGQMSAISRMDHTTTNVTANVVEFPRCGRWCGNDTFSNRGASSVAAGYFTCRPNCP